MREGYYIYEPLRLSRALAIQELHELLIEFLDSLINEMYIQLSLTRSMVIVEMIEVTYYGSYPAVGIKNCDDLLCEKVVRFFDSIVEDELDGFLQNKRGLIDPELVNLYEGIIGDREK